MKIGRLNELLPCMLNAVTLFDSTLTPLSDEAGNPLKGETYRIKWDNIRDEGITFHISLSKFCFVDTLTIRTAESTALTEVRICVGGNAVASYCAETGKTISDHELELQPGILTDNLQLTVFSNFSGTEILGIDLYGAYEDGTELFPTPNCEVEKTERIPVNAFSSFTADSELGVKAGAILNEKFFEITGRELTNSKNAQISFITDVQIPVDGYRLEIDSNGALIHASNFRGFVCGAECFIKLTNREYVQGCKIADFPRMPMRGVHLYMPAAEKMDFAKRLVKYLISPMGYNVIIIEVGASIWFQSHPEINEAVLNANRNSRAGVWPRMPHDSVAEGTCVDRALVKDLLAYIRDFGIEVIPEVQSLGHVQVLTHTYPEIAEIAEEDENRIIDTRVEDARPKSFYPHCYCPSNELSYKLIFDILDEIIEIFEPREYVHMGHDEVYQIGVCPKCKDKDPAQLFAYDVNRLHDYLADRGLKMMIWADMLQPVTKYRTPPAIDLIPKDIVLLDFIWYFHLDKDIEDNLLSNGFKVGFGNLYSSHFPRYETRSRKDGIIGGQISAWMATNEEELQQEGKLYDFMMTAQMLWSKDYAHMYRQVYDRMISGRMPALRANLSGRAYPSLETGAVCETIIENSIQLPPVLPVKQITSFCVKDSAYRSLILTHTCLRKLTRLPWKDLVVVGKYILNYADGTSEELQITNGGNIGYWNRRQNEPFQHPVYRHNGYTAVYYTDAEYFKLSDGSDATFYRWEYALPEGKKLSSVKLEQVPEVDANVFLYRVEGVL